jgi:hypothetical protein
MVNEAPGADERDAEEYLAELRAAAIQDARLHGQPHVLVTPRRKRSKASELLLAQMRRERQEKRERLANPHLDRIQ